MKDNVIYVEGINDAKFLQDYIKYKFNFNRELKKDIIILGTNAIGELEKNIQNFKKNTDYKKENLIIFDANGEYGNFSKKLEELNKFKTNNSLECEIFLIPNHSDNGNIEDLLENIINPANKKIFECFEKYQDCLKQDKRFFVPIKKTKIYAYIDTLITNRKEDYKAKEKDRDYRNFNHWNLNNEYLNPLFSFLSKYFS